MDHRRQNNGRILPRKYAIMEDVSPVKAGGWVLQFERMCSILETKSLFVLEYSFHLKRLRINSLDESFRYNLGWFARGEPGNDYKMLAISSSRDQLREFRKLLDKQKKEMK
jgi:hypothetical protein